MAHETAANSVTEAVDQTDSDYDDKDFELGNSDAESMFDFETGGTTATISDAQVSTSKVQDKDQDQEKELQDLIPVESIDYLELGPAKEPRTYGVRISPLFAGANVWKPLPQQGGPAFTRVLRIERARGPDSLLECSLEITSLPPTCAYYALSYAWGQKEAIEAIFVDEVAVLVSPNLKAALTTIRDHWDSSTLLKGSKRPALWVDALCINQQDEVEKSIQVSLMGEIYAGAGSVLVWLGQSDPSIDDLLSRIHPHVPPGRDLERIMDLTLKPWFFRRWAVQEASLAADCSVLVGKWRFPLAVLIRAVSHRHGALHWTWAPSGASLTGNLLQHMIACRSTQCSDDRDRIYALRAISTDGTSFPVDYKLSFWYVYVRFAVHYAYTDWLPTLLICAAGLNLAKVNANTLSHPTWVPDWRLESLEWALPPREQIMTRFLRGFSVWNCGIEQIVPEVIWHEDPNKIALELNAWTLPSCQHVPSDRYVGPECLYCVALRIRERKRTAYFASTYAQRVCSSPTLAPADLYCILDGCYTVFALRRTASKGNNNHSTTTTKSYELLYAFAVNVAAVENGKALIAWDIDDGNLVEIKDQMVTKERIRLV